MHTVELTLDAVFHERVGRAQTQFMHIENLYELPRLQYLQHTSEQSIAHLEKKNGFIILVLYTHDGKIYVQHDGTTRALPAASMKTTEDTYDGIQKALRDVGDGRNIHDVQPILFVDNTFCHKDKAHTMHGIVYAARIPHPELFERTAHGDFIVMTPELIESVAKYGNKDILSYVTDHLLTSFLQNIHDQQDDEIETNRLVRSRYLIHRSLGKPLLKILGLNKNSHIKDRITSACENATSIIDVSCGDDNTIYSLAKKSEVLVVWNDISRSQLELCYAHKDNILFTNHNASKLPFKNNAFDVALCKNTLHHMPHRWKLLQTLASLKRVAKKIVIVEIENPQHTGGFAYWLHKHRYRGFLKDVGGAYIGLEQFHQLLTHAYGISHTIQYTKFATGQWTYMCAVISPHENPGTISKGPLTHEI